VIERWSKKEVPDQTGRVAVVTGGNGGLGLETVRVLAAAGAHVVMAARNLDKANDAAASLRAAQSDAAIDVVPLDLGDLRSVRDAAASLVAAHPAIDILVNNAGIMAVPEGTTADGFETQFGTNHLGHFAFTALLMPSLLVAPASRVVTVTSTARHVGKGLDPDTPLDMGGYDPWRAYGRSKLANLHFAVGLHRRLTEARAGVASLAAHPGLTNTDLQSTSAHASGGGVAHRFWEGAARYTGMSPARGALAQIRAATDPSARSGELYAPRFVTFGSPVRRPLVGRSTDPAHADRLWTISERETAITFDVAAMVGGGRA
jgi:NAD(P)-dependent dehydrogenase (short-subunit alcohol dehydrogenase family)